MDVVTGLSIKYILLDRQNWWRFSKKFSNNIRFAIMKNIAKILACCNKVLGFHKYTCSKCGYEVIVPHSCKSRFCSICGKKATDNWIAQNMLILPKTTWQHITFTMPSQIWNLFWMNRNLFNVLPAIAANVIKKVVKKKKVTLGMFAALHTFGRDLKRNVHIHLSVTTSGLSQDNSKWITGIYFHHQAVKNIWKFFIISLLRKQYNLSKLKLPKNLNHIKNYITFNSWLNMLYKKKWVVNLARTSDNHKYNVEYLGKYLKRPPIGENRIKKYDGKSVSFEFLDHYTNEKKMMTLSVEEFIARIISHIPDKHFKCIRYYGFLANRVRSKLLPIVYKFVNMVVDQGRKIYITWRDLINSSFGYDPLTCPNCHIELQLTEFVPPAKNIDLIAMHEQIACAGVN